jgi:hypothetical protein
MRLFRPIGAIVGLSCMLPQVAASQVDSPPAEVQRLQFYVGSWNETGQMRDDPGKAFQPIAGGETCKWSAGGYAVLCEEKTEGGSMVPRSLGTTCTRSGDSTGIVGSGSPILPQTARRSATRSYPQAPVLVR